MQPFRLVCLFSVVTTASVLLFSSSGGSVEVCDEVAKTALAEALKHAGIPGVEPGMVALDAWLEYVESPDDKKLDAAVNALAQGPLDKGSSLDALP